MVFMGVRNKLTAGVGLASYLRRWTWSYPRENGCWYYGTLEKKWSCECRLPFVEKVITKLGVVKISDATIEYRCDNDKQTGLEMTIALSIFIPSSNLNKQPCNLHQIKQVNEPIIPGPTISSVALMINAHLPYLYLFVDTQTDRNKRENTPNIPSIQSVFSNLSHCFWCNPTIWFGFKASVK